MMREQENPLGAMAPRARLLCYLDGRDHAPEVTLDGYLYNITMNELLQNHFTSDKLYILKHCPGLEFIARPGYSFMVFGVKKAYYYGRAGIGSKPYLAFCGALIEEMGAIIDAAGYVDAPLFLSFDLSKQLGMFFAPTERATVSALALAERLNEAVNRAWARFLPERRGEYPCLMALTGPLAGVEATREAYREARALNDLSFFRMEAVVLTPERLHAWARPVEYDAVMEACRALVDAFARGHAGQAAARGDALFSGMLKRSFSFAQTRDALSYLRYKAQLLETVYFDEPGGDLAALFDPGSYLTIEECYAALIRHYEPLLDAVRKRGTYAEPVLLAVYYIKRHYQDAALSIADVAAYARVTAGYLSRLFTAQTGTTIVQYIKRVRLQAARRLLSEGKDKVYAVAGAVGIGDVRYFSRLFKEAYGEPPQQFREKTAPPESSDSSAVRE